MAGREARRPVAAHVVTYSATVSACKRANGGRRPWKRWTKCVASGCSPTLSPTGPLSSLVRRAFDGRRPGNFWTSSTASSCRTTLSPTVPQSARAQRANGGRRPWNCLTRSMASSCSSPNVVAYCATTLTCEKGLWRQKARQRPAAAQRCRQQCHDQRWHRGAECLGIAGRDPRRPAAAQRCHLQCHRRHLQEGQRWQKALEPLVEMRSVQLRTNVVTYSATFIACEEPLVAEGLGIAGENRRGSRPRGLGKRRRGTRRRSQRQSQSRGRARDRYMHAASNTCPLCGRTV